MDLRDGAPRQSLLLRSYWLVGNSSLKFNQGYLARLALPRARACAVI